MMEIALKKLLPQNGSESMTLLQKWALDLDFVSPLNASTKNNVIIVSSFFFLRSQSCILRATLLVNPVFCLWRDCTFSCNFPETAVPLPPFRTLLCNQSAYIPNSGGHNQPSILRLCIDLNWCTPNDSFIYALFIYIQYIFNLSVYWLSCKQWKSIIIAVKVKKASGSETLSINENSSLIYLLKNIIFSLLTLWRSFVNYLLLSGSTRCRGLSTAFTAKTLESVF